MLDEGRLREDPDSIVRIHNCARKVASSSVSSPTMPAPFSERASEAQDEQNCAQ